jgi:hypothetical protein
VPSWSRKWLVVVLVLGCFGLIASASAAAGVYLNVPSSHPERPSRISVYLPTKPQPGDPSKFLDVQASVSGISWSSWGEATATGSGRVLVNSSDTRPGHQLPYASQSASVSIVASGLTSCAGQQLYTTYSLTLTGADPEPRDFDLVRARSMPCRLQALNYYAGYEAVANTTGDCLFKGVSGQYPSGLGFLSYCRMRWQGWSQSRTVGTGIARAVTLPSGCDGRHSECDYGIRVELGSPAWCPAYGLSYTRERLEVFGHGVLSNTSLIAPSEDRRLRATIGRGQPTRIYYDRVRPSQHCTGGTPATASTRHTVGFAAASSAEACQATALSHPSLLSGRYQTYNVPNDNHYEIRFALPPLAGCDSFGKRRVTIFQQKREPYGVHQTLQWSPNGLSTSIATNQAKRGAVVLRAAHLCSSADAYGDYDKKHHIKVRPAVKLTWRPNGGAPISAIFSGTTSPACR